MKIITIEGAECVGKTTFCKFLKKNNLIIEPQNDTVVLKTVNPDDVYRYRESGADLSPTFWEERTRMEQAEYFLQEMADAYKMAMSLGCKYMVCDRFYISTLIYQAKTPVDHILICRMIDKLSLPIIDILYLVGLGKRYGHVIKYSDRKPRVSEKEWKRIKSRYSAVTIDSSKFSILQYTKLMRDETLVDAAYNYNKHLINYSLSNN